MARPSVIVLAVPHVFATLIADSLRARDAYEVTVPDLRLDEWPHGQRYDAAITSLPVSGEIADVVIELPESLDQPLRIRTPEVTVEVPVHVDRTVEDALDALDRYLLREDSDEGVSPARPPASSP